MSKAPKAYPGYHTVGMGQAASYAVAMVRERDSNKCARLCAHLLLLLSDADKAFGQIAGILQANEQYHELLKLVEDAGITLLSSDPEKPLSLGGDE